MCCRCSEKAKKSLTGNARVLNLYNDCTLNYVRLCPSYCNNPEQCILGVALNRTTVWRASEVQKELFKPCLFPISRYIYMLIKIYLSQHFSTKIIFYSVCCKPKIKLLRNHNWLDDICTTLKNIMYVYLRLNFSSESIL